MAKEQEWEQISGRGLCGDTCRLRVPGGWLYRERECANRDGCTTAVSMVFVPESPDHLRLRIRNFSQEGD